MWTERHGHQASDAELRSTELRTAAEPTDAQLPSKRTIEQIYGTLARLQAIGVIARKAWRVAMRDAFSGEEIRLLDFDDLGYEISLLALAMHFHDFGHRHPKFAGNCDLFWHFVRDDDRMDWTAAFPGGRLGDLDDAQRLRILEARHDAVGLFAPRVDRYRGVDGEWCDAVRRVGVRGLSLSARARIENRCVRLEGEADVHRRLLQQLEAERWYYRTAAEAFALKRPEETDPDDPTVFCEGHLEGDQACIAGFMFLPGPSVAWLFPHQMHRGWCLECGRKLPFIAPLDLIRRRAWGDACLRRAGGRVRRRFTGPFGEDPRTYEDVCASKYESSGTDDRAASSRSRRSATPRN
jgi:hypothetical protein